MNNPLYAIHTGTPVTNVTTVQNYVRDYRAFLTPALADAGIDVVATEDPTELLNHHMNEDPDSRQSRLARVWSLCWLIEYENNPDQRGMMMFELGKAAAVLNAAQHIPAINTGTKVRKAGEQARDKHNRERSYPVAQRRRIVRQIMRDVPVRRDPVTNRKISMRKHVVEVLSTNHGIHISEATARDDIAYLKKSACELSSTA